MPKADENAHAPTVGCLEKNIVDPDGKSKGYHFVDQCWVYGLVLAASGCNHYARDAIGPIELHLEGPAEEGYGGLSVDQYNLSLTLFFIVNVVVPLIAGVVAIQLDAPTTMLIVLVFGGIGNILAASTVISLPIDNVTFQIGRTLAGFSYEAFDILCMPIITKYISNWYMSVLIAIGQASIRAGSVASFSCASTMLKFLSWEVVLVITAFVGCAPLGLIFSLRKMTIRMDAVLLKEASARGLEVQIEEKTSTLTMLTKLSPSFWMFILGAGALYGAMVPFWFIGSKYLHDAWGFTDVTAAALMAIPELMMVVVAVPWGFLTDKQKWGVKKRLWAAAASTVLVFSVGMTLFMIAFPQMRWFGYILLPIIGTGFAIACTTAWAVVNKLNEDTRLHGIGAAILGAAINLLPAVVINVFTEDKAYDLSVLAWLGVFAALSFSSASMLAPKEVAEKEML